MSRMAVVPMKRKMQLWMSVVEIKDGVYAFFLELLNRIVTVKCSHRLTACPRGSIIASDCNGKGDRPWAENKNIQSTHSVPKN